MKVAVLGTGMVGRALAGRSAEVGHDVVMGTRDPSAVNDDLAEFLAQSGGVGLQTFADAATGADLVILAVSGSVALDVAAAAGEALAGRVVLDLTNPLDFSQGMPPSLFVSNTDSLAEHLQRAHPTARVVKALNTLNADLMVHPDLLPEPTSVFVCGDDDAAKSVVVGLLGEFGHPDILDLGALEAARGAEMFLPLWLRMMGALGTATFNIRVVR